MKAVVRASARIEEGKILLLPLRTLPGTSGVAGGGPPCPYDSILQDNTDV